MKIVLLQGSARKKGNTAKVLEWVEETLSSVGHEVETIYLTAKNMKGCLACGKCKEFPKDQNGQIGCVQKDDIPEILGKIVSAKAVVFASPLYFWGVSAQLKTVIDRTYSLYTGYHQPGHASLVDGQRQALLVTGAGPWDNNAEAAFTAFSRIHKPHKSVHTKPLYVGGCTNPANMDETIKQQAIDFAQALVQ